MFAAFCLPLADKQEAKSRTREASAMLDTRVANCSLVRILHKRPGGAEKRGILERSARDGVGWAASGVREAFWRCDFRPVRAVLRPRGERFPRA